MVVLLALCMPLTVLAEVAPEDAARYRQAVMKALSGHNGAIRLIVAGRAGDPEKLAAHIAALVELSTEVEALFQEGSDLENDEALPAIWERPDAFAAAVADFESASEALGNAANGGDSEALGDALRQVGDACKACHESYRLDD